jgi:methylglutaconyl-CoA hydratase
MPELATLEIADAAGTLTLRRPDRRNALSLDLLEALRARVAEAHAQAEAGALRVLIITGEGRAFCAGMDLKAVLGEQGAARRLLSAIAELTLELRSLPCPTIAKVNAAAIGGGCGLMCVCDFSISHEDAKIGFPEVDLGVCPAVVAPWLQLRVGHGRARSILLTGGLMTGREAFEAGMLTSVTDRDALDDEVNALRERLAAAGPNAMRATKRWMNAMQAKDLDRAVRDGAALSADVISSDEATAALRRTFAS